MKTTLIAILVGILLTFAFGLLGGFLGGACHCTTPSAVFFPYGTAVSMRTSWAYLGIALAVIQFPVYGLMVTAFRGGKQVLAVVILLTCHAGAFLLNIYFER